MAAAPLQGEFDLIRRHFAPLAVGRVGALGLTDDAAFLDVDPGSELVVTTDALVAGVHFLADDPPELIARKALRVNLSDLAAKGAAPLAYFLTVSFPPSVDESWVAAFCGGLAADQAEFGVQLMGGDTTSTPGPLTLSITALGQVPRGRGLKRSAARQGDLVLVSGTIGDGALGLMALRGGVPALGLAERQALIGRYHLPMPRTRLGPALAEAGLAHAAIDVSDGVVADLGHVCAASGLGAEIEAARVPLSPAAAAAVDLAPELLASILTGGDDYEILFTASPDRLGAIEMLAGEIGLPVAVIGRIGPGQGVRVRDPKGGEMALPRSGYRHF